MDRRQFVARATVGVAALLQLFRSPLSPKVCANLRWSQLGRRPYPAYKRLLNGSLNLSLPSPTGD